MHKSFDSQWQPFNSLRTTLKQWVERVQSQPGESVLRSFYDGTAIMMGVVELVDDDIVYISCNTCTAAFFGRTTSSMRGLSARQMGAPDRFVHSWLRHCRDSEALGGPVHFEYNQDVPDEVAWLAATVHFIGYAEPGRSRFSFVVEDISGRKRAEATLIASEQRFRSLVEQSTDGLIVSALDFPHRILDVNRRTCEMLGYTREELLSMSIADIEQNLPADPQPDIERIRAGERVSFEGVQRRKDGTTSPVEVRIGLYTTSDRVCLIALARDITERRRVGAALKESELLLHSFFESASMIMGIVEVRGE